MSLYKKYLQQEANTNHPIKNTILIYKSCIAKFHKVEKSFEEFKFIEADESLERLEMAFYELKMQVNDKADEGLAGDLYDLYDWILLQISDMRKYRKAENIKNIEVILKDLIEGYETILKNNV